MIAALVAGMEELIVRGDDVVFEFAHGLKLHAGDGCEGGASFLERIFRRTFKRRTVLVEVGAEDRERGDFSEGVNESSTEAGYHVEVAPRGFHKGKEAGSINAFAVGEDGIEMRFAGDDEIERF